MKKPAQTVHLSLQEAVAAGEKALASCLRRANRHSELMRNARRHNHDKLDGESLRRLENEIRAQERIASLAAYVLSNLSTDARIRVEAIREGLEMIASLAGDHISASGRMKDDAGNPQHRP